MTGVSGSGKSSLAFHTIYKEGQFRYIESLSSYLRQMFNLGSRPELEYSSGLSPAVSIEQNKRVGNSRSTMGTLTELDDYLRLMMSKLWEVFCHECGDPLRPKTTDQIVDDILLKFDGQKVYLLQDFGLFEDASALSKFVKKNRRQVDNGWGLTRLMIELGIQTDDKEKKSDASSALEGESIEYFYLEDPKIPDEMFPVKVSGVFDRITVGESVIRRLKDDVIKMLGRTEKFGVRCVQEQEIVRKDETKWANKKNSKWAEKKELWWIMMSNSLDISDNRKQKLIAHEHTDDWFIHTTRAIIKNEKGEYLGMYDTRFKHYQVPWGKVDAGETIEQGFRREVEEETWAKISSLNYVGWTKILFRLGAYVEHMFEVELSWDIEILEPEKFSHVWQAVVKNAKRKNISIDFGDTKRTWLTEIMEWGDYAIWAVVSGLAEKLQKFWEYAFELIPKESIDPKEIYVEYLDTNLATMIIVPESKFKASKTRLIVFKLSWENLLLWYDAIFWEKNTSVFSQSSDQWSASTSSSQETLRYTDKYYCAKDDIKYPELTPAHFSANRQEGACDKCHGLGEVLQVDFDKVLDPYSKYLKAFLPWRDSNLGQAILKKLAQSYDIDPETRWGDLPDRFRVVVLNGDEEQYRLNIWWGKYITTTYKWVEDVLISQYQKGILTVDFQAMLDMMACPSCDGAKLCKEALAVHIVLDKPSASKKTKKTSSASESDLLNISEIQEKYNIHELQSLPIEDLVWVMQRYMKSTTKKKELTRRICLPLLDRAETIQELGLWYLATFRKIDTLSGWEIQRLRLAKQLGNKLTGIIYVLDEPTIWLNQEEIKKVIKAIRSLQDMWNTIIVVEHNDDFIKTSDWIVEVGPGAGDFGWEIVFNGPYDKFIKSDTLTSQYITGKKKVKATFDHKPSTALVKIKKASKHNLQGIDVDIALGSFTIITWPSGAGKTTLMYHTLFTFLQEKQKRVQSQIRLQLLKEGLSRQDIIQAPVMQRKKYEHLEQIALEQFYQHIWVETIKWREEIDNVMYVNQSSIGKTPRSCPSTFVWVFDDIRKMFAGVTEAKMLGFGPGHFSFNSAKWACPECKWYGWRKVELQFLPDAYVPCELCKWRRYKPEILDIRRHEHTISQILDMYVMDAYEFFEDIPFIKDKLQLMMDIGLWYLKMGQPAHTLSWGESQRLKLVKHLLKQYRGHTVYFLDEPTVGLHPQDIERLLSVLKKFLDHGDTILMIEHDQHLINFADKVVRLENWKLKK